jgi:hexosaminidase
MKLFKFIILTVTIATLSGCAKREPTSINPDIIPLPYQSEWTGGSFKINGKTGIFLNTTNENVKSVAEGLQSKMAVLTGKMPLIENIKGKQPGNSIFLRLDHNLFGTVGEEGYILSVKSSSIEISASKPAGLFYGIQTIYQLLPPEIYKPPAKLAGNDIELEIPCIEMTDKPAFSWRGMHLDVSRHFFPKEFIKKYIDLIALHKMNVFHWHLTDDNGWRIQIDRYPLLTEVSAWRADRNGIPWTECEPQRPGETTSYGGFYTKDDIREIVEYARQRFVKIVPEIEMPGHTSEVFAAYPEFSCSGEKIPVQTGSYWPNNNIFCAGDEGTFRFLENILDEVIELFPSEYIHIGGDEADKTAWRSCPDCQTRIRKEGLSGVGELQSYFVKRIEKYISSKGRKMIGWDEILEGGLAPGAAVMSWRGFEGGIEAAQAGHQVVMCPVSHCYFDYYQADPDFQPPAIGGLTTLKKVYSFRPVPAELKGENSQLILGGQGNIWTEYISTQDHAVYMALPRMTALSEVLWTPEKNLLWEDFRNRLQTQFARFDEMGVKYFSGSGKVEITALFTNSEEPTLLKLQTEAGKSEIYYTLNGNKPDKTSFKYKDPIAVKHDVTLKAVAYTGGVQLEKPAEYKIIKHSAIGKTITYRNTFSERYPGNGTYALNDGIRGSLNYNDGYWQGFNGIDADIVIDLGQGASFKSISSTFLLDQKKWIFFPDTVNYYLSIDGTTFQKMVGVTHDLDLNSLAIITHDFSVSLKKPMKIRYLRIEAKNIGVCPDWHPGKGQKAWLFLDEIVVK